MPGVYEVLYQEISTEAWARIHHIEENRIQQMDWKTTGRALRQLTFSQRKRVLKAATGTLSVGRSMEQWRKWNHSKCPCCDAINEDVTHVWRCPDPQAQQQWKKSLKNLQQWMIDNETMPELQQAIINALEHWRAPLWSITQPTNQHDLLKAIDHQNQLGWSMFLHGSLSPFWKASQELYQLSVLQCTTGQTWAVSLLRRVWMIAWSMWDHCNEVLHSTITMAQQQREKNDWCIWIWEHFDLGEGDLDKVGRTCLSDYTIHKVMQWDSTWQGQWL